MQKRGRVYADPAAQSAAKRRAVAKKAASYALAGDESGMRIDHDSDVPIPVPVTPTPTSKQRRISHPGAGAATPGTPHDDSRSLRKSTVTYSRIREEERRREAEEAVRRRKPTKMKAHIPLTQEQLLEEAIKTEELNKISLSELIKYEEETKKYTVNKPKYVEFTNRFIIDGINSRIFLIFFLQDYRAIRTISFQTRAVYCRLEHSNSNSSNIHDKLQQTLYERNLPLLLLFFSLFPDDFLFFCFKDPTQMLCAITGLPAKYRDPKTKLPFATIEAQRALHKQHRDAEMKSIYSMGEFYYDAEIIEDEDYDGSVDVMAVDESNIATQPYPPGVSTPLHMSAEVAAPAPSLAPAPAVAVVAPVPVIAQPAPAPAPVMVSLPPSIEITPEPSPAPDTTSQPAFAVPPRQRSASPQSPSTTAEGVTTRRSARRSSLPDSPSGPFRPGRDAK
jgi:hypothetical protein